MKQLKLFLLLLLLLLPVNLQAQTLVHPQKVYINPNGVGGDDTLKIDGGLKAGPSGTVTVINADGTLAIPSSSIADGSIAIIKLNDDCTDGEVLIRNAEASAPFWECGVNGSGTGIVETDNNISISGTGWRFQNATVFGSSITAQELIHVYNSGGDAGIQIQNNTQPWKLLATGTSFRIQSGTNYPITLNNTQVGIFNTSPTAGYEVDITGDVRITGTVLNLGAFGNHVYASASDTFDLGTASVKWRNIYSSSLIVDQFVQQNVQLYNGYQIIGKESGSFNAAVANVDSTFVADEDHEIGDYILIRGRDAAGNFSTEYVVITNKSGAGPYTYTVTRDLDGSGANSWNADTQYLVLGKQYDGRIELYAASGIPSIRVVTQGASYSAFDSLVHLGGLDGISGISGKYGIYIGKNDGSGDYLKFQNHLGSPTGDDGKLIVKGGLVAGSYLVSNTSISLTASGLDVGTTGRIQGGRTAFASNDAGFWIGYDSGYDSGYKLYIGNADETKFLQWDGSNLTIRGTLNASDITTGTLNASLITVSNLSAASITTGTLSASYISGGTLNASLMTVSNLSATSITSGTMSADRINGGTISGQTISGGTITGTTITGGTLQTLSTCGSSGGACIKIDSATPAFRWYSATNSLLGTISGDGIVLSSGAAYSGTRAYRFTAGTDSFGLYGYDGGTDKQLGILATSTAAVGNRITLDSTNSNTSSSIDIYSGVFSSSLTIDTTGTLTLDGGSISVAGNTTTTGTLTVNNSGGLYLTGGGGTDRLYNINSSGFAIDATNNGGNPSFLNYNASTFLNETLYMGYTNGGTATITTYYGTQNLEIVPTGALYINPGGTARVYFTDTDIEVAGIMLRNWVDGAGQGYACANVNGSADGFITYKTTASCGTSSIRYKTNVQPMSLVGVEAILDLTPVTYKLKALPESGYIMGAIAEQAADLGLEWMVERNEKGEPETLIYDRIGLYLIPVVKAQKERIDDLERRIEALERRK